MDSLIVFQAGQISEAHSSLFIIQSLNQIHEENIKQVSYDMHSFRTTFLFISTSQLSILLIFFVHFTVDKYRSWISTMVRRFLEKMLSLKSKATDLFLELRALYLNSLWQPNSLFDFNLGF